MKFIVGFSKAFVEKNAPILTTKIKYEENGKLKMSEITEITEIVYGKTKQLFMILLLSYRNKDMNMTS